MTLAAVHIDARGLSAAGLAELAITLQSADAQRQLLEEDLSDGQPHGFHVAFLLTRSPVRLDGQLEPGDDTAHRDHADIRSPFSVWGRVGGDDPPEVLGSHVVRHGALQFRGYRGFSLGGQR